MFQVDDEPMETIHLYVVRESDKRPSWLPVIISLMALSILVAIGVLSPYQQPVTRASIRVPAVPLGVRSFTASVAIVPTGLRTYPATTAHGTLTITNGSIIAQVIPAGFIVQNAATDRLAYVPAGSANGYGYATVPAHALISGENGDFAPLAINQVIGSSVYIRNLSAFTGGYDSYSVKYATERDKVNALQRARSLLAAMVSGLHYPCSESLRSTAAFEVTWRCQYVTYHLPSYLRVSSVRLIGKNLIVAVWFIAPQKRIWVK